MKDDNVRYDSQAAAADGVVTEESVFVDYWGFDDEQKHYLSDGKQYFLIQRMNEGQKAKYQRDIRNDITVERSTGNAKLKADPATERHALLKSCVTGWNMKRRNKETKQIEEVSFVPSGRGDQTTGFEYWLAIADPRVVEDLEKACRKLNPWLLQEMSVEDIDKEIENLREMRDEVAKREAGE